MKHTLNYRDMVDVLSTLMEFSARENQEGCYAGKRLIMGETKEISENTDRASVRPMNQLDICFLLSMASRWLRLIFFHYSLRGYKMEKNKKKKNVYLCAGMCLCSSVWMDKCVSVGACAHGRQQSALDVMSQEPFVVPLHCLDRSLLMGLTCLVWLTGQKAHKDVLAFAFPAQGFL